MLDQSDTLSRTIALSLARAREAHMNQEWRRLLIHARNVLALTTDQPEASQLAAVAMRELEAPAPLVAPAAPGDTQRASDIAALIRDLRPLDGSATQLLTIDEADELSSRRLIDIISLDQALTAKMLRLANSAFLPSRARVESVRDAIVRLGLRTVRSAALSACLMNDMGQGNFLDERVFWRHSVTVAILARMQAEIRHGESDQAFTGGLVHNIGLLALDQTRPDALREAVTEAARTGTNPSVTLRDLVGCSPAELGAAMAERWNFPTTLVEVIEHSGAPDSHSVPPLVACVRDARAFARSCALADGIGEGTPQEPPPRWLEPPLGPALESAGGGDGILERADAFLGATGS